MFFTISRERQGIDFTVTAKTLQQFLGRKIFCIA